MVTIVPQVRQKSLPLTEIISTSPPPTVILKAIPPPSLTQVLPIVKEKLLEQLQSESIELLWKEESEHYSPDRDDDDSITETWAQVHVFMLNYARMYI